MLTEFRSIANHPTTPNDSHYSRLYRRHVVIASGDNDTKRGKGMLYQLSVGSDVSREGEGGTAIIHQIGRRTERNYI